LVLASRVTIGLREEEHDHDVFSVVRPRVNANPRTSPTAMM